MNNLNKFPFLKRQQPGQFMRILILDDDETLRFSLKLALELQEHETEEASSGSEALEKINLE